MREVVVSPRKSLESQTHSAQGVQDDALLASSKSYGHISCCEQSSATRHRENAYDRRIPAFVFMLCGLSGDRLVGIHCRLIPTTSKSVPVDVFAERQTRRHALSVAQWTDQPGSTVTRRANPYQSVCPLRGGLLNVDTATQVRLSPAGCC